MLHDTSFGSNTTSPPMQSYPLDQLGASSSRPSYSTHPYLPTRHPSDRSLDNQPPPPLTASNSDPSAFGLDPQATTIMIRRMPPFTSSEAVNAMLLFSGDFIAADIIPSPYLEDIEYTTACARFRSAAGAYDAQTKLQGKSVKGVAMIVELESLRSFDRHVVESAVQFHGRFSIWRSLSRLEWRQQDADCAWSVPSIHTAMSLPL